MLFNPSVLHSAIPDPLISDTIRINGSYNPMQFVLRLSKEIHQELAYITPGIHSEGVSANQIQAFSTYLHETIHWWQHVGSNFGLITSLKYPTQAHQSLNDLKSLLNSNGAFKSILEFDAFSTRGSKTDGRVNRILNYWFDLQSAGDIAFIPQYINEYFKKRHFVSLGHSYHIMWSSAIRLLSTVVDFKFDLLPDVDKWHESFKDLVTKKIIGFDPEPLSIQLAGVGTKAIFEGQARLSQIQYLYFTSGTYLTLNDFANAGLLDGIYLEALSIFLRNLSEPMPERPDHPLIGLFLLVCEIAINPADGFPFDIHHFESFIYSIDPGWRFMLICDKIKMNPHLKNSIQKYSKEEYIQIGETLSNAIVCISPYASAQYISIVCEQESSFITLLEEEKAFNYKNENLPVRLFFSKYLRFQQDKVQYPHFFCWPGIHMVGRKENTLNLDKCLDLFHRHQALYVNDINNEVQFVTSDHYDEANMDKTFNDFFAWNSNYDMIRQWIIEEGPFQYPFRWLTKKYTVPEIKHWMDRNFENTFKVQPDNFKVLLLED